MSELRVGDLVRVRRGKWEGMFARVVDTTESSVKVVFDDWGRGGRWYARSEVDPKQWREAAIEAGRKT